MLFMAGSLNNYVKNQSLQFKAQQRLNDVNMKKGLNTGGGQLVADSMQQLRKDQAEQASKVRTEMITLKLKSGGEISGQDLDFLRENAPDLYTKALRIVQERKAYEESLKRCRTKDEVERVKMMKVQQFAAEAQSIQQSGMSEGDKIKAMEGVQWRLCSVMNQHNKFVKTKEYAKLPTEEELRKKKEEKEKETGDVKQDKVEIRDYHWDQQMREALDLLKKEEWQDNVSQEGQEDAAESGAASGEAKADVAPPAGKANAGESPAAPAVPSPAPAPAADPAPVPAASNEVKTPRLPAGARA